MKIKVTIGEATSMIKPHNGLNQAASTILDKIGDRSIVFEMDFHPSESRQVSAAAPSIFLGRHLVIEPTKPEDAFHLCDIQVGRNSQLVASGSLDARSFAPWSPEIIGKIIERDDATRLTHLLSNLGRIDWAQASMSLKLIVQRWSDLGQEPIPFRANLYGDWAETEPEERIPQNDETRKGILPFSHEYYRGETLRVRARPQTIFRGHRLIYSGPPQMFVLHDILVGWHSFWKDKGMPSTPMEEFAPIPPKAREAIMARSSFDEIKPTVLNAQIGTASVSQEITLLIECIAPKGGYLLTHLIGETVE